MTSTTVEKHVTVCQACDEAMTSGNADEVAALLEQNAEEIEAYLGGDIIRVLEGTVHEGWGASDANECGLCGSSELGERFGLNVLCYSYPRF